MKRLVYHTRLASAHEMPLFEALARRFDEAIYVVESEGTIAGRVGWRCGLAGERFVVLSKLTPAERAAFWDRVLTEETLVYYGYRDSAWREKIVESAAQVVYAGERWLRPVGWLPGWIRLLSPRFRRTVRWYREKLATRGNFRCFAQGVHAAADFRKLDFGKVTPWGYFVAAGTGQAVPRVREPSDGLRVLWLGRMVPLKHADTVVRAFAAAGLGKATLTLAGDGPSRLALEGLVRRTGLAGRVRFTGEVALAEVRALMREHDVFVLASDAREGWGMTLSEALAEGLSCFGTDEAGASATLLPAERRFACGDWRALAKLLASGQAWRRQTLPAEWTAENAAGLVIGS